LINLPYQILKHHSWHTPKLLSILNNESKCENNERIRSWGMFFNSQHFGVEGHTKALGGDYDDWQASQLLTRTCANQITSWLVDSSSIFSAWTNHMHTQIHKIHHGLDLGEATTFLLIIFYVHGHMASTQMSFCLRIPKLESQNSRNWDSHNFGGP
jgi:hypothetical protein